MNDLFWQILRIVLILLNVFVITSSLWNVVKTDLLNQTKYAEKLMTQISLVAMLIYAIDFYKGEFTNSFVDCTTAAAFLSMAYCWLCHVTHYCKQYRASSKSDESIELEKAKEC